MSNYLVLGGSGFIGKSLINFLERMGHSVTNIDIQNGLKFDLRTMLIPEIDKFSGCFFLAWDVGGAKYINQKESWKHQFSNNISILNNMASQLSTSNTPFLFVTSQLAGVDNSPYSLSKLLAENYFKLFKNCVLARQWNAYGVLEAVNIKSHVISDMIIQAVTKGHIELMTDGSELRRFIHVIDICEAYFVLINNNLGQMYDVRNEEYISIYEVAELISDITGATIKRGSIKGLTNIVKDLPLVPDWSPKINLANGIKEMIQSINWAKN